MLQVAALREYSATEIQRIFRGFNAVWGEKGVNAIKAEAKKDDFESTVNWAVLSIQRYVRGHQAKSVVVNKRVELGLSDRLQRLAHRYLQVSQLLNHSVIHSVIHSVSRARTHSLCGRTLWPHSVSFFQWSKQF